MNTVGSAMLGSSDLLPEAREISGKDGGRNLYIRHRSIFFLSG